MTTGQYPRRRETDDEARVRNARAENMKEERLARAIRVPGVPFRELLPRLTQSGRLFHP